MMIPGFNAEASVYQTNARYRASGSVAPDAGAVEPAFHGGCLVNCFNNCSDNDPYCAENCLCICHGKPGKTCWLM